MFRIIFSILYLTFNVYIGVNAEKNCDSLGILVYEDLGCKVIKRDGKGCPAEYDCGDFAYGNDSCVFRGKAYSLQEKVHQDLTYPSCDIGCFCENHSGLPKFTCAILDCPEWLGSPIEPGCYRKYKLNECCSAGITCPLKRTSLTKCNVDGRTYMEDEQFYPKNTCLKCVCPKNWNQKFDDASCRRRLCNIELRKPENLQNKCAPCYFSKDVLCCPNTWVCPASDQIIKVNNNVDSSSELSCVFGSKTVKLGEGFRRKIDHYGTEKNVQCECVVPPLLTCKEV